MNISFANPAGLWALLGIPAIIAIHFLQTKSRRIRVSTLFLLEPLAKESTGGSRIERLRNSVPLWLQLLTILLLAWLLAAPRWIKPDSTQSIVVVLDSSISMRTFQKKLNATLPQQLRRLEKSAARTEWILLESDTTQPTLYSGGDLDALVNALEKWKPHLGAHDFTPALRLGQSLMRLHGLLIFVTDHRVEKLPAGVELLAVGTPTDNCGFAGMRIEADGVTWHALVKNYGMASRQENWWMETGKDKTAPQTITLQSGETLALKGTFPAGAQDCTLVLEGDAFPVDDRMPMVVPQPKILTVSTDAGDYAEFFEQFLRSAEGIKRVQDPEPADLKLFEYSPLAPAPSMGSGMGFVREPTPRDKFLAGQIIAERDPLMDNLNWQGLLCKDTFRFPEKPADRVLLWQGDIPLVVLRGGAQRQLLFNFDLDQSNAKRLPAFVILMHRFMESVRAGKIAPETLNVETNQTLVLSVDPTGKPLVFHTGDTTPDSTLTPAQAQALRAPVDPGFFEVTQGSVRLLKGAAHFADVREADLRKAESVDGLQNHLVAWLAEKNSRQDFLAPVWALLAAGALVLNWAWPGRRSP